jgi:hypothetical protein
MPAASGDPAIKVIAEALNALRVKVTSVQRTGKNPHFRYDYVEESHLISTVRQAMIEVGLVLTPEVPGEIQVFTETGRQKDLTTVVFTQVYHLAHVSGHAWPWPISVAASGQDVNDKHVWKASTGASKYAIMRLLQLATGDDPEQDHGLDAPPKRRAAKTQGPSSPTQRGKTSTPPEEMVAGMDEDEPVSTSLAREVGMWPAVFQAAERAYGKDEGKKFACMDAFLEGAGLRSTKQLKVKHITALLQFAKTWDPVGVGEESQEPPFEDDELSDYR